MRNHKFGILSILMILGALNVQAQEDPLPSWCPVEEALVLQSASDHPYVEIFEDGLNVYSTSDGETVYEYYAVNNVNEAVPSDDGEYVAMIRADENRNMEIWTVNRTNSEPRLLVSATDIAELRPENEEVEPDAYGILNWAWVPGTSNIVFNTRIYYFGEGLFSSIADDLIIANAVTGEITTLLPHGNGGNFIVSLDGQYVAVEGRENLSVFNLESGENMPVTLENYQTIGIGNDYYYAPLVWRADRSTFVIAVTSDDNPFIRQHDGVVDVYEVDAATQDVELIATHNAFYMVFDFSSDLDHVAYWLTNEQGSNLRTLYVADLLGEERLAIETGESLQFVEWLDNSVYFSYRIQASNSNQIILIDDFCGSMPNYPDVHTEE